MRASDVGPPRALVCAPLPPEYDRESGSRRIYHMIEMLRGEGWSVAFVCERAPTGSPHVRHLRQLGVPTYVGFGGHTPELIEAGGFDVAIFAFWYMADRHANLVRRLSPVTRIVVASIDLHWLRNARRLLARSDGAPGRLDDDYASDFVAEVNAYAAADGVLTVSGKEAALVNDLTGDPGLAHAVPDYDHMEVGTLPFEDRRGILFVGNFRHPPNLDAVEYLCREILPLLPPALLAQHPVSIVGNGPGARVMELADSCPGVEVVGWVPSLVPYLHRARVSVVPLRYGAGTKRKLIQALLAGTPSVTTSVGVEGLEVTDGEDLLVADAAAAFAAAVERLLDDSGLWSHLAERGRASALKAHGRGLARSRLLAALGRVVTRPRRTSPGAPTEVRNTHSGACEAFTRAVEELVPAESSLLVVSKGDPALVDLPQRFVRHFPEAEDGRYAGFHPRDSRHAIQHLEAVRGDAQFLVFPPSSLWWLEYYAGFARHLREHHEEVASGDDCLVYRLRPRTDRGRGATDPSGSDGLDPGRRRDGAPGRTGGGLRGPIEPSAAGRTALEGGAS